MKNELCARAESNVARYLTQGAPVDDAVLAHMKECSACAVTLQRAQALGNLLGDTGTQTPAAVEANLSPALTREVAAAVRRRRVVRAVLGIAVLLVGVSLWTTLRLQSTIDRPGTVWLIMMLLFTLPLIAAAATAGIDVGPARLYKRLRGRELSGVCQGLSEKFSIPVWILRMAFVALVFADGAGIILYLIFDTFMTIHPDDRSGLLRFRIARWWKRRVEAA